MNRGTKDFAFETSVSATSKASPQDVYDVVADLPAHLEWSSERAKRDSFKLLTLEAPAGVATAGTAFSSTGASGKDTFHDRSTVVEASPPSRFAIETDARLDRKRAKQWKVQFVHRYDIQPADGGSRITNTDTARNMNYIPYWLQPGVRALTRMVVGRADTKQLENLARMAEERAGS